MFASCLCTGVEWREPGGRRFINYPFYHHVIPVEVADRIFEAMLRAGGALVIPASFVDVVDPPPGGVVQEGVPVTARVAGSSEGMCVMVLRHRGSAHHDARVCQAIVPSGRRNPSRSDRSAGRSPGTMQLPIVTSRPGAVQASVLFGSARPNRGQ